MNGKRFQKTGTALLLALILGSTLSNKAAAQEMDEQPSFEEAARLADMRAAAIRGDRTQIPAMIKALNSKLTRFYTMTALRALSELQATEALPDIDAVIVHYKGDPLAGFARVVKARIMAECAPTAQPLVKQATRKGNAPVRVEGVADTDALSEAGATLDRFLSLLNLDIPKIKAAVVRPADKIAPTIAPDPEGVAVCAQKEIADMALHNSAIFLALPKVRELDYSPYPDVALKMKIAPMSQEERVKWLIDDLSRKKVVALKESYEIQLAIDEGLPASHYAVSVLKTMSKNQKDYPTTGFHALFILLDGVWNEADHQIIATFAANVDPEIRHSSAYYPHYKHQSVTGF